MVCKMAKQYDFCKFQKKPPSAVILSEATIYRCGVETRSAKCERLSDLAAVYINNVGDEAAEGRALRENAQYGHTHKRKR